MPDTVRQTVEKYCQALAAGDAFTAASLMDPEDLLHFWQCMCDAESLLTSIGELGVLEGLLGAVDIKQLSPQEFMATFLKRSLGDTEGMTIRVDTVDELSPGRGLAVYNVEGLSNTLDLVHRNGRWHVKMRAGMESMVSGFKDKVEAFKRRETLDQPTPSEGALLATPLYGFCDEEGRQVIEPRYQEAHSFSEGLAAVQLITSWGYINRSAELVIPARYSLARPFSEGVAWVAIRHDDGLRYSLIDTEGRTLISPRFRSVEDFSEGLAPVKEDGLWGYVDKTGSWVLPPRYQWAEPFEEGLAEVTDENGLSQHIDHQGVPLDEDV